MLVLMLVAVVIPIVITILFAKSVGNFAHSLPFILILGLSILALIGFMLIAKVADLSYLIIFSNEVATSQNRIFVYYYFTLFKWTTFWCIQSSIALSGSFDYLGLIILELNKGYHGKIEKSKINGDQSS